MQQHKPGSGTVSGCGRAPAVGSAGSDDTGAADKPDPHLDERLDEELDETFPASDPIPYNHDDTPRISKLDRRPG